MFTVNGQSGRSNSFLVDGMDNNDLTSGTNMGSFFSQQVIDEFVLLTNQFAAEFGRASGGMLNIVTRQGSNDRSWDGFLQGTTAGWNRSGTGFSDQLRRSRIRFSRSPARSRLTSTCVTVRSSHSTATK